MIEPRIVRRYATALFSAASKAMLIDNVESDLGLITYTLESSPALFDAMASPMIPAQKKKEILRDLFEDKITELTLSYLYLLVDKRREEAMLHTEGEYIRLANEARGIMEAQVWSAVELSDDERNRLKKKLGDITGKTVNLIEEVKPEIIGGVIVKLGDTLIDGSIRGQLEALREKLKQ